MSGGPFSINAVEQQMEFHNASNVRSMEGGRQRVPPTSKQNNIKTAGTTDSKPTKHKLTHTVLVIMQHHKTET